MILFIVIIVSFDSTTLNTGIPIIELGWGCFFFFKTFTNIVDSILISSIVKQYTLKLKIDVIHYENKLTKNIRPTDI